MNEASSQAFQPPQDVDGRLKRTGGRMNAIAHIITVFGSGVLSSTWAMAQLGWVAGPAAIFLFTFVTYYTSTLQAACYRRGDPVADQGNNTYMDAVRAFLGKYSRDVPTGSPITKTILDV